MAASLAELRRAFPSTEIHALVDHRWAPLLEHLPSVNRIWGYRRKATRVGRAQELVRLANQLRNEHFEGVINFHASTSSALLSRATGASIRSIHFHGLEDKNLFSTVEVPGKGIVKPIIERDLDALRALGISAPSGVIPQLAVTSAERDWGQCHLKKLKITSPILGMGLGASRPAKSWSISQFVELAHHWCTECNGSVCAMAAANESGVVQEFRKLVQETLPEKFHSRIHIEIGAPIRELAALIQNFAVFIGNDSGPRHIAVAVGVPSVTLFGPEHPYEWHPYPKNLHPYFFTEDLNCRKSGQRSERPWCGAVECPEPKNTHHRCMTSIDVKSVLGECLRVARNANDL